jgi:uncharacterized phage protein gp47/JayE
MAFQPLTVDESHALAINFLRRLLPDIDVSEESLPWAILGAVAGAVGGNFAHNAAAQNDTMPDTATRDMADRWGNFRGVLRKGASPASKPNALRFVGIPNTPIPDATKLVHRPSQLQFRTVGPTAIGAGASVDVSVIAIDVGSKTRLAAGEVLSLQESIPGVQDDAELQLPLDQGGDDAEEDDDYVPRYLQRWKNPPLGGTASDFVKVATDAPEKGGGGMAAAYCYPNRMGFGSVDLAPLHAGSGQFRVLAAAETSALFAIMNAQRPVGMRGFRVLQVVTQIVNVEVTIFDDGSLSSAPDWDDTTPPTCAGWTASTRMLQLAGGTRPSSLQPNDRITFSDGATGRERVVESLSGTDSVVLVFDPLGDVPTPGTSIVYAGGQLVEPSRRAVQAVFDALGTANPDQVRYGAWEGNLRPTAISRAITAVPGVLDVGALVSPTATVTANDPAANPLDSTIGLLIAGRILVRRAH